LARYQDGTWSTPAASGNSPIWVDSIAEAPNGSLWVVANGDLYHLDEDQWRLYTWPADGWIDQVAIGPDGVVWVGYDGLGRFDPDSRNWQLFSTDDGLIHPEVQAIHVTPDGVVWVGTPGGVSRFVPQE
jgi:ligand-binding sensor domain-containing protein